ncbi:MAG: hypothetical protein HYY15_03250 [Candidatus Omnitrophica bacterium]|nr:hypothetical protein [Candidatus Omnitrophota bacterium]
MISSSSRLHVTRAEFERFRLLLEREGGLALDPARQSVLHAGLAARMDARRLSAVDDYARLLTDAPEGRAEIRALLQEVTVGETQWFRYRAQFDVLTRHLIPDLVKARGADRRLAVWSAGCSTGEEPYSIAMALLESLPQPETWAVTILATDLHRGSLARAERGWYPARSLRGVPAAWRERYFLSEQDGYRVRDRVKRLVRFAPHNLARDPFGLPDMRDVHLLWCRNVTIYFTPAATARIIAQFAQALGEGGYLFLGHAETLWGVSTAFAPVVFPEAVVYRKASAAPAGLRAARPSLSLLPTAQEPRRQDAAAQCGLASSLADAGRHEEAIRLLQDIVRTDALSANAHYLLGLLYHKTGRRPAALHAFERARYLEPLQPLVYLALAIVHLDGGEAAQAQQQLRQALTVLDEWPDAAPVPWCEELRCRELRVACRQHLGQLASDPAALRP